MNKNDFNFEEELNFESLDSKDIEKKFNKIKEELTKTKAEGKEYLDGWKRSKADSLNEKKRYFKDIEILEEKISIKVIEKILPILDSIVLGLENQVGDDVSYKQGLENIYTQYTSILSDMGVSILDPKNTDFDPNLHQSIGFLDTENKDLKGKIVKVARLGATLNHLVIRAPMVYIGK